jgi:hypothetical protein
MLEDGPLDAGGQFIPSADDRRAKVFQNLTFPVA